MASKTFLLLALALLVVLLVTSEVAAAKDLASNPTGDVEASRGGRIVYGQLPPGAYGKGGRYNCKHGCCNVLKREACKCCATFEEAIAYKQTHN
ncbi:hypothetical protein L1987_84755 [Smallanthus sonchifolius]|uniref:Uncharacterized protein n=1 Tax=Smallanthus sonchifolius TaxID=185202 RepID=A0ACB8XW81_9ASTR|nr:hypothetical protein L1987_84755 [Smallanthus sonchifolius]